VKNNILSGFAIVALAMSMPVWAADLPVNTRPSPLVAAPFSPWSGFYLGLNGGGAWGKSRFDLPLALTSTGDFNTSGGLVGGTVGFNWQIGAVVFGVEGDFDWASIKGSATCGTPAVTSCQGLWLPTMLATNDSWLATVRGRLGFAGYGGWLFYATGGGAFGDAKMAVTGPFAFTGSQSVTKAGWTAGGGVEFSPTPNWSVKAEYLHVDLGTANCPLTNCSLLSQANVHFLAEIVRVGVNYRLDWGAPVTTRY